MTRVILILYKKKQGECEIFENPRIERRGFSGNEGGTYSKDFSLEVSWRDADNFDPKMRNFET